MEKTNLNPVFEGILSDHNIIPKEEATKMQQYEPGVLGKPSDAPKTLNEGFKRAMEATNENLKNFKYE